MLVLLVDDENYILEYLSHVVNWKSLGFSQVDTSTSSIESKLLLKETPYDLLITDIRMPEVSGVDLLKFIDEQKLNTKVIFLSGYSEFEYAQQAIKYGLFDYLLKPLTGTKLKETIQEFTKKYPNHAPSPPKIKEPPQSQSEKIIETVKHYIIDNIEDDISLKVLSELVFLTPPYLSSLYKKETGSTLSNFITNTRLNRSAVLLKESRLKVADIAQLVGYKKPQYFDQIFQKKFGQTPQQYRRSSTN